MHSLLCRVEKKSRHTDCLQQNKPSLESIPHEQLGRDNEMLQRRLAAISPSASYQLTRRPSNALLVTVPVMYACVSTTRRCRTIITDHVMMNMRLSMSLIQKPVSKFGKCERANYNYPMIIHVHPREMQGGYKNCSIKHRTCASALVGYRFRLGRRTIVTQLYSCRKSIALLRRPTLLRSLP